MPALHDIFAKNVLYEALDPVRKSEMEKPIAPLDEQFIDLYCEPLLEPPPPDAMAHLGILHRMTEKRCMLEPFSTSPSIDAVDGDLRKQHNLHHRLRKDAKDEKLAKPLLWILSPGRPEEAMSDFALRPATGWPPGVYSSVPGLHFFLVVLAELPETADTRLLRLLGAAKTRRRALAEINQLPGDDPQRRPLLEILVELRYLLRHVDEPNPEERDFMTPLRQEWEQYKAKLIADMRRDLLREVTQEALTKGRAEALLAVLAARGVAISEAVRSTILACHDLALLDRWLARSVTVASADELLGAAA